MSDQSYQATFFVVPARILNLPGITLAFLRFYETIFQFWNHGKVCYLSNGALKERTGITSSSTIQLAFEYFELNGEMKRKIEKGRRYLIRPEMRIEIEELAVDNSEKDSAKISHPLDVPRPPSRQSETPPLDRSRHKNKKLNTKNLKRESLSLFEPDEANTLYAKSHNIDLAVEVKSFMEIHKGEKTQFTFERWLVNAKEYKSSKTKTVNGSNEIRSTVPEYDREDYGFTPAKPEVANHHLEKIRKLTKNVLQGSKHDDRSGKSTRN